MHMANVTELPNGKIKVRVSSGSRATLRQRSRTVDKPSEVRRAIAELEWELELEGSLEPSKFTVASYLAHYLNHIKADPHRSRKAIACTQARFDTLPASLRETRLRKVKPLAVQKWLDDLQADHAASTVAKYRADLSAAFERAVDWDLIVKNPVRKTTKPAYDDKPALDIPDEDGLASLLDAVRGTRYWAPAVLAAFTGMRRGTLLALRWRDIDAEHGCLHIRKRLDEENGKPCKLRDADSDVKKTPKKVELDDQALAVLKAHKKQQAQDRLAAKVWHEHGLVFPDKRGDVWRPSAFSVGWGRLMAKKQVKMRFHDLRHTHGTLLLRAGVPINAVMQRLGHANLATTQRYVHVLEDADRKAAEAMAAKVRISI